MGVLLEDLTWPEAERVLQAETVVVLPVGAASKEHGLHLRLDNDARIADHLRRALLDIPGLAIAPVIGFHHYPAFVAYSGSVSLREATARDLVVDIARSYAAFGPHRFYALNTGISTVGALRAAARELAQEHVLLGWTDLTAALGPAERSIGHQERGTHADETETSLMLHLDPDRVDMAKAVREMPEWKPGGFQRKAGVPGTLSPSGVFGDPTLATAEKGRRFFEALVQHLRQDLETLRSAKLPATT